MTLALSVTIDSRVWQQREGEAAEYSVTRISQCSRDASIYKFPNHFDKTVLLSKILSRDTVQPSNLTIT